MGGLFYLCVLATKQDQINLFVLLHIFSLECTIFSPYTEFYAVPIWGLPALETSSLRRKGSGGWKNLEGSPVLPGQANLNNLSKQKFAWTWTGCLDSCDCTQVWPCTSLGLCWTFNGICQWVLHLGSLRNEFKMKDFHANYLLRKGSKTLLGENWGSNREGKES